MSDYSNLPLIESIMHPPITPPINSSTTNSTATNEDVSTYEILARKPMRPKNTMQCQPMAHGCSKSGRLSAPIFDTCSGNYFRTNEVVTKTPLAMVF